MILMKVTSVEGLVVVVLLLRRYYFHHHRQHRRQHHLQIQLLQLLQTPTHFLPHS
jgi:hypothetical protein